MWRILSLCCLVLLTLTAHPPHSTAQHALDQARFKEELARLDQMSRRDSLTEQQATAALDSLERAIAILEAQRALEAGDPATELARIADSLRPATNRQERRLEGLSKRLIKVRGDHAKAVVTAAEARYGIDDYRLIDPLEQLISFHETIEARTGLFRSRDDLDREKETRSKTVPLRRRIVKLHEAAIQSGANQELDVLANRIIALAADLAADATRPSKEIDALHERALQLAKAVQDDGPLVVKAAIDQSTYLEKVNRKRQAFAVLQGIEDIVSDDTEREMVVDALIRLASALGDTVAIARYKNIKAEAQRTKDAEAQKQEQEQERDRVARESEARSGLADTEKRLGPNAIEVAVALEELAQTLPEANRQERLRLSERAVGIRMAGEPNAELIGALIALGDLYGGQVLSEPAGRPTDEKLNPGDVSKAAYYLARAVAIMDANPRLEGVDAPFGKLLKAYELLGQGGQRIRILQRQLRVADRDHGADSDASLALVTSLIDAARKDGRVGQEDQLLQRRLRRLEKSSATIEAKDVAQNLIQRGEILLDLGRSKDAVLLLEQALRAATSGASPNETLALTIGPKLYSARQGAKDVSGATRALEDNIALVERLARRGHFKDGRGGFLGASPKQQIAGAKAAPLLILATEARSRRDFAAAERFLRRVIGSDDEGGKGGFLEGLFTLLARALLADTYLDMGNSNAALQEINAIDVLAKQRLDAAGRDHFKRILQPLEATSRFAKGEWKAAARLYAASIDSKLFPTEERYLAEMFSRSLLFPDTQRNGGGYIRAVLHYWNNSSEPERSELFGKTLEIAQRLSNSRAAAAYAQMIARSESGNQKLQSLIREQQDLEGDQAQLNEEIKQILASPSTRNDNALRGSVELRQAEIDHRLGEIDRTLNAEFAEYAALSSSRTMTLVDIREKLSSEQVLVLFADLPTLLKEEGATVVWAVTKDEAKLLRLDAASAAIAKDVEALRCGLDESAWFRKNSECEALLATRYEERDGRAGKPLPFDVARAHALYRSLLGPFEKMTAGKQLLIVPNEALSRLPFQVLVATPPAHARPRDYAGYKRIGWLGLRHGVTVLPSVASLGQPTQSSSAAGRRPYLGIGNPLLDGKPGNQQDARRAAEAKARGPCEILAPASVAFSANKRAAPMRPAAGRVGEITLLKSQAPLPETADEVCAVGRSLGAAEPDVLLGRRATETRLKELSRSDVLRTYDIIHFATHGLLSQDLSDGPSEPGLILTPPDQAGGGNDDGLLTASEIAVLKLDARWVVLSACNTAGADKNNSEAFSGLARAFIYAGARSVLVSHWYVDSDASRLLIEGVFRNIVQHPQLSRGDALRHSITDFLKRPEPEAAHPAYWGPFVVVGR